MPFVDEVLGPVLIRNIGELFIADLPTVPGPNDSPLASIRDAFLLLEEETIRDFGPMRSMPSSGSGVTTIDAEGGAVIPGLIDSHTHLVFAGSREEEFVLRAQGRSYLEIAKAGGGIQNTVRAVREASLEQLVATALPRLGRMLAMGVTTIEVKSGYGLNLDDEIKMLEAVRRLKELQPIELVPTYLAAHTVPDDYRHRRSAYLDLVVSDELMGRVAEEGLAEFCDVFCEDSAFGIDESRRILLAGIDCGLAPKIHADQITQMGASRLAAEVGAVSAEHLDQIDDEGIRLLKGAGVIAGLLPACGVFLGVAQAPARRILSAGVPVAIATDYNPGSSMVESLPLTLSLACTQMRLTPAEVLVGATANAAASLSRSHRLGRIARGLAADLVLLDLPSVNQWLYRVGRPSVRVVIKSGRVVHQRDPRES